MSLTLNTSHPLYPNLVELIGIDPATGQFASAKTARTIDQVGNSSYPTTAGTFGKAGRTSVGNVFSITPEIVFSNLAASVVVVTNSVSVTGTGEVRQLVSSIRERTPFIQINDTGRIGMGYQYNLVDILGLGTTDVRTGAHVLAVTHGASGVKTYVDGALEGSNATVLDLRTDVKITHIGGVPGFNAATADIVWVAVFDKVLSASEISTLSSSVAGNNVIGLLDGASQGGTPTVSTVSINPTTATVSGGGTQQFTATATGTNNPAQSFNWSATGGTVSGAGLFTAPAATASIQNITITAQSTVDTTKSSTATVSVPATGAPPVTYSSVSITPSSTTVQGNGTQQFGGTVSGTGAYSTVITWSVDGASNGSINSSGLYTAPAAGVSARNVIVRGTAADGTTSGTASITVPAASGVGVFVSDELTNNTGQVLTNISVRWSWYPNGRIGYLAGITPLEGVGTTNSQGKLTATGLNAGAGLLLGAQLINNATDDLVFVQAGTVL